MLISNVRNSHAYGTCLVLLDRDGTINKEVSFICKPEQVELLPGAAQAIHLLNEQGIKVVIVSNQSAVARKMCTEADIHRVNAHLVELLAAEGATLDAIYFCPHHPGHRIHESRASDPTLVNPPHFDPKYARACECRKPGVGLLLAAAKQFGVDPADCFMVGDSTRDILAGKNFGCKTILVQTGYGGKDGAHDAKPDHTCKDLADAARLIVKLTAKRSN